MLSELLKRPLTKPWCQ